MEPNLQDINDTDEAYLARRARRRERWLRERRRRERRRRCAILLLGLGAVCLTALCIRGIHQKAAGRRDRTQAEADAAAAVMPEQTGADAQTALGGNGAAETDAAGGAAQEQDAQDGADSGQSGKQDGTESDAAAAYQFTSDADTKNIYSEEVISANAILVNADTDVITAGKGAYDRISPASMTKVLTVLVAAEAIGEEHLDDPFTITREITDYAYVNDCSSVGFSDGETVTVRDLFYGAVLASGGDAAVGLADYAAGSQEAFVELMNRKLEALGIADSAHFTNCVGLYDAAHYCSVYDMAVIMKAAMANDWCREVLSAHTYTTTPTTEHPEGIEISNWFLRRIEDKETGGLVVGAKTGYVVQSGNCAVSYEEYADGTPYICVTAGSTSAWRCIYDHVEIYNRYIGGETQQTAEQ